MTENNAPAGCPHCSAGVPRFMNGDLPMHAGMDAPSTICPGPTRQQQRRKVWSFKYGPNEKRKYRQVVGGIAPCDRRATEHKCFYRTVEREGQFVTECETCKHPAPASPPATREGFIHALCEAYLHTQHLSSPLQIAECLFAAIEPLLQAPENPSPAVQPPATPLPRSAHVLGNPPPWPKIWSVQGDHSNIAYFNEDAAKRYLAERTEPQKYRIVEYVPIVEAIAPSPVEGREQFEKYWRKRFPDASFNRTMWDGNTPLKEPGEYISTHTYDGWLIWQAASSERQRLERDIAWFRQRNDELFAEIERARGIIAGQIKRAEQAEATCKKLTGLLRELGEAYKRFYSSFDGTEFGAILKSIVVRAALTSGEDHPTPGETMKGQSK